MCQSAVKGLLLGLLTLAVFFQQGIAHIGEKCTLLLFCTAQNSYCDSQGICRCKPDYPVKITDHKCLESKRHGQRCKFPEQCSYTDKNSYCTQVPYQSNCDCYSDHVFSEVEGKCVKVTSSREDRQSLILPTILGIALAAACVMCCCLALWHFCQSRQAGEENRFFRGFNRNRQTSIHENNRDIPSNHHGDTLPPYEMIVRESEVQLGIEELPPSYDDVMKQVKLENKEK